MHDEIKSQHAKFAYLKGTTRNQFVWRHALKPSLFPVATFFPIVILTSFLGGLFIEKIFLIPGSGSLTLEAVQNKDTYVLLFLTIIMSILTIFSFYLRDALYKIIDPRLRGRNG